MGPFEVMNKIGVDRTYAAVEALTQKYADFKMPRVLARQKELGRPFDFRFVDLEVKDGIGYITINRPEAMNALNEAVVSQLDRRFKEAESNPAVTAIAVHLDSRIVLSRSLAAEGMYPAVDPLASQSRLLDHDRRVVADDGHQLDLVRPGHGVSGCAAA